MSICHIRASAFGWSGWTGVYDRTAQQSVADSTTVSKASDGVFATHGCQTGPHLEGRPGFRLHTIPTSIALVMAHNVRGAATTPSKSPGRQSAPGTLLPRIRGKNYLLSFPVFTNRMH